VEFLASLDAEPGSRRERLGRVMRELHARGALLAERMWNGLASIEGVRVFGPAPGTAPRTPTMSFVLQGLPSADVSHRLADEHGIFCSHGDFYATDVARCLGVAEVGLVRAGAACYTSLAEVDRLIAGVGSIARETGGDRS
jgi:selenocysteine lyase/cysteine desulfurase